MEDQFAAEHSQSLADTRGHAPQGNDRAPVSLTNALPVELVEEIFWHFTRDSNDHLATTKGVANPNVYHIPTYRKPYGDPIILGTVCKFWRDIALSIAGLWSTIFITTDNPYFSQRLPLYLSRCGSEPLTLSLLVSQPPPRYSSSFQERLRCQDRFEELCADVLSLIPRCKRLYLDLHWEVQYSNAIAQLYTSPPLMLEELSANLVGAWDTRKVTRLYAYLQASPALRRVRWKGLRGTGNSTATHKLLHSINTTTIHDIELCDFHRIDEMLPFLRKCENLERFTSYAAIPSGPAMAMVLYGTNINSAPHLTVLGRLQTLSLLSISSLGHIFDLLVLPSLSRLSIDHCWDMESTKVSTSADIGWESLQNMLERSQCQLRSLEYMRHGEEGARTFSQHSLVRFLKSPAAQWLEELHISAVIGDETLEALTPRLGQAVVCPSLRKLIIGECSSTDGVWSDMVLSRSRCASRLESASVQLRGESQSNFTRDLLLVVPGVDLDAQWRE